MIQTAWLRRVTEGLQRGYGGVPLQPFEIHIVILTVPVSTVWVGAISVVHDSKIYAHVGSGSNSRI